MDVSIIIPTFNRRDELNETLDSILEQTIPPIEIIIVDDSDNDEILSLTNERKSDFSQKKINLIFIKNWKKKSSAIARNIGIDEAQGNVILFLDDDVSLDKNYIKNILKLYLDNPEAIGVQGFITNFLIISRSRYINALARMFYLGYVSKNECKVLASTNLTYPSEVTRIIECQWLSGANQSYRRDQIDGFRFDENFLKYSFKEDFDFSYRVYKKYPHSIFLTPDARLIHRVSDTARMQDKLLTYMEYTHSLYLFFKNFEYNIKNIIIFSWSWLGYLIIAAPGVVMIDLVFNGSKKSLIQHIYMIEAILFCLKNIKQIEKGNLTALHQKITQ